MCVFSSMIFHVSGWSMLKIVLYICDPLVINIVITAISKKNTIISSVYFVILYYFGQAK